MSAWWDDDHRLLLLTPEEFASLPDGEVLVCIDESVAVKGVDKIDDDTRFGHLAYGVVGNHPLRVAHLEKTLGKLTKREKEPTSLLRPASKTASPGCYCGPGRCMAPKGFGCRDPEKAARKEQSDEPS